jgi:hypothetical protein
MRRADSVTVADSKAFTAEEFGRIMRSCNFVGAVAFWRTLDRLAHPELQTRLHATGMLRELAKKAFDECEGLAFSPQEAECLQYCGFAPAGVRPLGSLGRETDSL